MALTFHGSGDIGLLDELLAVAGQHDAPLTIFAVGQWLDDNPDVAKRIVAANHEMANHTYTHPSLATLGPSAIYDEINKCRDALARHAGTNGRWFRPSAVVEPTPAITAAAAQAGYQTVVGYDIDPLDYQDPGARTVQQRIESALHPGAIVSLHTGHRGTVEALDGVLTTMRQRGLAPVTVSTLLQPSQP